MDWLSKAAEDLGWSYTGPEKPVPGSVYVLARGPERIEIEIGNGGIPNKVRRTTGDNATTVLGSAYFRMAEVKEWMEATGGTQGREADRGTQAEDRRGRAPTERQEG